MPALPRGALTVAAIVCIGLGAAWGRLGAGDLATPVNRPAFFGGLVLIVTGSVIAYGCVGAGSGLPPRTLVAVAVLIASAAQPGYFFSALQLAALGGVLASSVLLGRRMSAAALLAGLGLLTWFTAQHWAWGHANIDVFAEVQGAASSLLHGQNPYDPVYRVIIDTGHGLAPTGSGHFGYGPAVILLSLPGAVLGDVRLSAALVGVSIPVAAFLMARSHGAPAWFCRSLVAVWLGLGFLPLMTLADWTDTFSVAGFVWWLALRGERPTAARLALGLAMAAKPSMLPLLVPFLLWQRSAWRDAVWAVIVAAVVVLPFAIWTGVATLAYDVAGVYVDLPLRHDSLNLNGAAAMVGLPSISAPWVAAGGAAALVLLVLRRPRIAADLTLLGAALFVWLCLPAKQAFYNYYFVAAAALLMALAAAGAEQTRLVSPLTVPFRLIRRYLHVAPSTAPSQRRSGRASAATIRSDGYASDRIHHPVG